MVLVTCGGAGGEEAEGEAVDEAVMREKEKRAAER